MSDSAQAQLYGYFQRRRFTAMHADRTSPMGTLINHKSGQGKPIPYRRPATAPPQRQLQWNGELRHRAWAPPPGGRKTLQEHLNIWGPKFGNQNVDNARRYRSEFRRQYTGTQLPVPPMNAGKAPIRYVKPGYSPALSKRKGRPQSAPAPKTTVPNYMKDTESRRNSKTAEDLQLSAQ